MLSALSLLALAGAGAPDEPTKAGADRVIFAIPLTGYDSNLLLAYGAFGQVIARDPAGELPFRYQLSAQLLWTTGGYRNHYLQVDLPGLAGSRFRLWAELRRVVWSQAPYSGIGWKAPRDHDHPDEYWQYAQQRLAFRVTLRRLVAEDTELFLTWNLQLEDIQADSDSLLWSDSPPGIDGGRYAWAALGVIRDTRVDEIDPEQGYAVELSGRLAHPWTGSEWTVLGVNSRARVWWSPVDHVVLAGHVLVDARWGETPFFTQAYAAGLGRGIIGGRWMFRGLDEERYRGDGVLLLQPELRWSFWNPTLRQTSLEWMLVPFVDAGRVWTWGDGLGLDPRVTAGMGLRLDLKGLVVLRADVALGFEEYDTGPERQVQVYILSEHPY